MDKTRSGFPSNSCRTASAVYTTALAVSDTRLGRCRDLRNENNRSSGFSS